VISRFGMGVVLTLASLAIAQAEWKENGKVVPDKPWAKSAGEFGAQLVLTDKPEELFAAWEKPGAAVLYSETATARRGSPIVAVVFFAGCAADGKGRCQSSVRFNAFAPDGKPYGAPQAGELWIGKPPPGKGQMQLGVGNLGILIEPADPLGVYKVKAEILDAVANKTMVLERTFTAVEADKK
jgi:hypothetical protein